MNSSNIKSEHPRIMLRLCRPTESSDGCPPWHDIEQGEGIYAIGVVSVAEGEAHSFHVRVGFHSVESPETRQQYTCRREKARIANDRG